MKLLTKERDKSELKLNMTAMIDIVFQLLVFFIMTFKVVAMEGDFNIKMPLASDEESIDKPIAEIIRITLAAGADGMIASIDADNGFEGELFNDENMYIDLTAFVEKSIAGEGDPSSTDETEVEFDIDYNLKYTYTVKAIEAVSGKVLADGTIKKLIEKIKFKDNSGSQGG